jgi:hypothetical protein
MVNGPVSAVIMPFAWDFVVNKHSTFPGAYLYSQWLTGPTM